MNRVLYISYDGILSPLGQSQVLAYQEKLSDYAKLHILSFEKLDDTNDPDLLNGIHSRMNSAGIAWHRRRYHKSPTALATGFDIVVGLLSGFWIVLRHRIEIVHARSYVPAVIALTLKKMTGIKFVFDMRGFWADERVDGGLWPEAGRLYRLAKWFEKKFLLNADYVISLTHMAVEEMEKFEYLKERMPPLAVIPTCTDLDRFSPTGPRDPNFVLGYVGSTGTWYEFDAAVQCFVELLKHKPSARLLILNRGEHDYIREHLGSYAISDALVEIKAASHAEIPQLMNGMSAGVFLIKPLYSKRASCPTKLGEFLGCGIPCLSNTGVGDMTEVLEGESVGVTVSGFDETALREGVARLIQLVEEDGVAERCVKVAEQYFSLDEGVRRYARVYEQLASSQ